MSKKLLIAVLGLHLLLAGCSGKPAPAGGAPTQAAPPTAEVATSASPKAYEMCKLLPQEEAEAIAGTRLDPGLEGPAHSPGCVYTGPTSGPVAQVEIYLGDGAKKFLDIDRDVLKHEFTEVPGIGDEAHEEGNAIFFRKDTTWVVIRLVRLNDPAENRDLLRDAAKTVGSRI